MKTLVRMILAQVCALVAICWPVFAQTVQVRSGEHATFTRLVLEVGTDRDWSLEMTADRAEVVFDPPLDGIDASAVFDFIPRTRLQALSGTEALRLDLACACPVEASRFQQRYLVIDISDPSPDETRSAPQEVEDTATRARRLAAAEALPDLVDVVLGDRPTPPQPEAATDRMQDAPTEIDLEAAAHLMAEQLARAAASGLISAAPGEALTGADPVDPMTTTEPASPGPEAAELSDLPFELPLRATTAVDAALRRESSAGSNLSARLACRGAELNLQDWSDGVGLAAGLGRLRAALYDERDDLVTSAPQALARHYLYYGFGAEAMYWLLQTPEPNAELVAMARLVDGTAEQVFPALSEASLCAPMELLWRLLDNSEGLALSEADAGAVQLAFAELPNPLQDLLGPQLARRFMDAGHAGPARNLRDHLVLSGRVSRHVLLRLDLDLGIDGATTEQETRANLTDALRNDAAGAPDAMAHALRFDRETGRQPSEDRLLAAEALLREAGVGPHTAALWEEVVLAQASAGHLNRHLSILAGPAPDPATWTRALTQSIGFHVEAGDTGALLLIARMFGADWTETGSEAGRTRVAAMAHLRAAGFTEAAELLRGGQQMLILPSRPSAPATVVSRAEEAWAGGDWIELAGLTDGAHQDLAVRMQQSAAAPVPGAGSDAPDLTEILQRLDDTSQLRRTLEAVLRNPTPSLREAP